MTLGNMAYSFGLPSSLVHQLGRHTRHQLSLAWATRLSHRIVVIGRIERSQRQQIGIRLFAIVPGHALAV